MSTPPAPGAPSLLPLPSLERQAGIFAVSALLKRLNVRVLSAERGRDGVELLEQSPDVDVVLVDITMPGMDGYETMRAMRSLPARREVPLVACTAKPEPGERHRCLDAGASAYLQSRSRRRSSIRS